MRSFISRVGGKSRLAPFIVSQFPEHKVFVEVFGGAAWVLFNKEQKGIEVYNDIDSNLVNLFRVAKYRPAALVERLNLVLFSRETHREFKKKLQEGDEDEIERAAVFYYLIKATFGANAGGSSGWGYSKTTKPTRIQNFDFLKEVQKRLERVFIDNQTFEVLIPAYDTPNTLFYCDPPYLMPGKFYKHGLALAGHLALRAHLEQMKGKFILSLNDTEQVRKLYRDFEIKETPGLHYKFNWVPDKSGEAKTPRIKRTEIIIKNF